MNFRFSLQKPGGKHAPRALDGKSLLAQVVDLKKARDLSLCKVRSVQRFVDRGSNVMVHDLFLLKRRSGPRCGALTAALCMRRMAIMHLDSLMDNVIYRVSSILDIADRWPLAAIAILFLLALLFGK